MLLDPSALPLAIFSSDLLGFFFDELLVPVTGLLLPLLLGGLFLKFSLISWCYRAFIIAFLAAVFAIDTAPRVVLVTLPCDFDFRDSYLRDLFSVPPMVFKRSSGPRLSKSKLPESSGPRSYPFLPKLLLLLGLIHLGGWPPSQVHSILGETVAMTGSFRMLNTL